MVQGHIILHVRMGGAPIFRLKQWVHVGQFTFKVACTNKQTKLAVKIVHDMIVL